MFNFFPSEIVIIFVSSFKLREKLMIFCAATKPAKPAEIPEIPTVLHLGRSISSLLGNMQFKQR